MKLNYNLMSRNTMTCIKVKPKLNFCVFMFVFTMYSCNLIDFEPDQIFLPLVPLHH